MNTTKEITSSARTVYHSLAGMRYAGHDVGKLLDYCSISTESLSDPLARIPLQKVIRLMNLCTQTANDELHGLLEKPFPKGTRRIMMLTAVHMRTLGRALQRSTEFCNLFENSVRYSLNTRGDQVELCLERIPAHRIVDNHALDILTTVIHRFIGWLCNERIILNQVKVDFPRPDYHKEYKHIYYGAPVLFNQAVYSINFDKSYLDHEIIQNEASVESYIRRAPLDYFLPLDAGGITTQTVRKLTKEMFSSQITAPTLEQVSGAMQVSTQILRRRLKNEGTSYQTIKAQVRRDIAIHHLGDPATRVEQVAAFTGYSEPSAFIRAFRDWTGFTPLQFRKGMGG